MPKAKIEYEDDPTSRLYRIKKWYACHHYDIKDYMRRITLMLMFLPAGYIIGMLILLAVYTAPIVLGIVAAFILAIIAVAILASDN